MVDGVEFALLDHVADVRHFEYRDAGRFEHLRDTGHEAVEIGHMGEQLAGPTIAAFGTPAQQERFLPGILAGTEQEAGAPVDAAQLLELLRAV